MNNKLIEVGNIPISDEYAAGSNVRYDEEYEFIEDELAKQGSMIDRGNVHWNKVTQACINILKYKSKDLKVSCYLVRALFEEQSILGLKIGLSINYSIICNYWDDLFPLKQRARSNAYEWLSDKFEIILDDLSLDLTQLDDLDSAFQTIKKIEYFLNEKFGSNAPALGNFRRQIQTLLDPLTTQKNREESNKNKATFSETKKLSFIANNDSDVPAITGQILSDDLDKYHESTTSQSQTISAPLKISDRLASAHP